MGKKENDNKAPQLTSKLSQNNIQESNLSLTEDLSLTKKRKRHKHTDRELGNENTKACLIEDLHEKKKKKKHKHSEKEDDSEKIDHINDSKQTDLTEQIEAHSLPEVSLQGDGKRKSKCKKTKKKRQENNEYSTDDSKEVLGKTEKDASVENEDVAKKHIIVDEETVKRKEERKQKKKDKKLKTELEKLKESEKGKDTENPVGPSGGQLALDYLAQWNTDKDHWKFQKVRQVWLLQNIYHGEKIGKEHFKVLLLYLEGMKGNSREITVKKAEEIITLNEESDEKTTVSDVTEVKLTRARQIIQVLAQ